MQMDTDKVKEKKIRIYDDPLLYNLSKPIKLEPKGDVFIS